MSRQRTRLAFRTPAVRASDAFLGAGRELRLRQLALKDVVPRRERLNQAHLCFPFWYVFTVATDNLIERRRPRPLRHSLWCPPLSLVFTYAVMLQGWVGT